MIPFYAIFAIIGVYLYERVPQIKKQSVDLYDNCKLSIEQFVEKNDSTISQLSSFCMQTSLKYIILYNETCLNIKAKYETALTTYPLIHNVHIIMMKLYSFIMSQFIYLHDKYLYRWKEPVPNDTVWREEYYYYSYDNNDFAPSFGYFYAVEEDFNKNEEQSEFVMHLQCIKSKCEEMKLKPNIYLPKERLFVVHDKEGYYHTHLWLKHAIEHECTIDDRDIVKIEKQTASKVKFIVVEYSHPEMKNKIDIKIDARIMLVGNAILSPCFVWRYLHMMPIYKRFVFDTRYKITIIDYCATEIVLNSNQYIILGKFDYKVCQIDA